MSNEYYFQKWKNILLELEKTVGIDLEFQETNVTDKKACTMVQRLSGLLGKYISIYKDAEDCMTHGLQVQKTSYIADVVHTVTQRVTELKQQLFKLEQSNYQFMSHGLVTMKLTTDDVEFTDIPVKAIRPPKIQAAIEGVWLKVKELKDQFEEEERQRALREKEEKNVQPDAWWEMEGFDKSTEYLAEKEPEEELDEADMEKKRLINLIKAQERCRQVTLMMIQAKQKRAMWEKILQGTARPEKPMELKIRAANLIQRIIRAYFVLKRKKITDCRRDEMLGLRMCKIPSYEERNKEAEVKTKRREIRKKYEEEWKSLYENLKHKLMEGKCAEIQEDYRDEIRNWFHRWYKEAWFFYDIPKAKQGGSVLILKEMVPSPAEWKDQNQAYADKLNKDKGKSAEQLKQEKKEAKNASKQEKREEAQKRKMEEKLLEKMMKNPQMHPGYTYPPSKVLGKILEAVEKYHTEWDDLDNWETEGVKKKFVNEVDKENAWAEAKLTLRTSIDDDMRNELKQLKTALKEDYETLEEEFPAVVMPQKFPRIPKIKRVKDLMTDKVVEQMVDLALKGYLKEYPKTKFEDFKGEPNFAGDDLRCNFKYAMPLGAETRNIWWERCKELINGFNKILLVGPMGSGKTLLAYVMATVNDAVLFEIELNPAHFTNATSDELNELAKSILACAKAAQPAVIYIKHVHRLFYTKVPPEEPLIDRQLINSCLIKKLTKKFNKKDKITVIASCVDPWLTKSSQLLKIFPTVIMMPNTTYTTTFMIIRDWVLNNRMVPPDLNVSCLAQVLQGYSFGYLQKVLQDFLTAERIVRMAAHGLFPQEIYDFILNNQVEKVEYDKYQKWYFEKTNWGQLEQKHLASQLEFEELLKKYEEKLKKKQKKAKSTANSIASSMN